MHKVWITRTQPAADESAQVWRSAGFEPLIEPLLDIQAVAHDPSEMSDVLIFTSKNAVDHISCQGQRAICVGDATAAHARKAGFKDVISVDGTSLDVSNWVKANLGKGRKVVHVSGWHVRGSIVEDLQAAGYSAKRVKVYRSVARPVWPTDPAPFAALYSPLAARVFADFQETRSLSGLSAICISRATADVLKGVKLKSVHVAARPREDELILSAKSASRETLEMRGQDNLS